MAKKNKLDVAESGRGSGLKHNPFATLGGVSAPVAAQPVHDDAVAGPSPDALGKPRGRLVLRREKKGRGGKTVVVVSGFEARMGFGAGDIAELTQHLKQQLGCGGAVECTGADAAEPEVVLQGDQLTRVAELLRARGFRVAGEGV